MKLRLPARLFASYLVVILVGAATAYLTVRLLAPPLFDHQMGTGMIGGFGRTGLTSPHAALISALNTALLVAAFASAAVGGVVAAFVTSRLLRPLRDVRSATRRIAAGDYDAAVPLPREPELAELAVDVNSLAASLKDTEVRRTRLLGDVAHEMRTPLTALDGYVEGFIDGVFVPTEDTLGAMAEELRRLHRLADDLSTLSRTDEQRLELRPANAELGVLVRGACERIQPQFHDAHVRLTVNADRDVPVWVDVDRITQVLTNVLGNALLATPEGGSVAVSLTEHDGIASVVVTDSGVGFASEDAERIFERFYRAGSARRRSAGSGVGLAISRGIARAHGGDLRARSDGIGTGATVTLTLPVGVDAPRSDSPGPVMSVSAPPSSSASASAASAGGPRSPNT